MWNTWCIYVFTQRISSICQYLTVDATKTLISAFVLSRLDYCNTLLSGVPQFRESKMQLQDSQSKLPNQTILLPFCTHSIGCQSQLEFSTNYPPSVTVLCQIPVLNICPGSCEFIHHRDNSVRPATTAFFFFFFFRSTQTSVSRQFLIAVLYDTLKMTARPKRHSTERGQHVESWQTKR